MKKTLRWLLFLPASAIATYLAMTLLEYFNIFSFMRMGYTTKSFFYILYSVITTGLAIGATFVYVGTFIVPKYQTHVSIILAMIINLLYFWFLVEDYNYMNSQKTVMFIIMMVFVLVGSIISVIAVKNKVEEGKLLD